ncbi:porin [Aliiroseovarius sp. KMU-50]|uniref:Porin n=1 Tax=Aliiroseovarius salicola TaxID=3009082 RepID=A0ABT4VXF3_9RHOB|nr:porin [Aliiroseovarius sp. KMU-50]MDA5092901.1 porin [Aliiroseovarius sp. KMU-50]
MKKVLFASTALVASAGIAAADVNLSGGANMGLKYNDNVANAEDLILHNEITLTVAMTGETDGGLGFGADMTITAGGVGDVVVYIEGGFGKLSAGNVDNAVEAVTGLGDLGFDGIGTDNIAETLRGDSAASLLYTGSFGDFSVAASAGLSTSNTLAHSDDFAVGAKYAMGDYSIAVAYDEAAGINAIHVQGNANVGDVALAALYSTTTGTVATDVTAFGITAGYTMGATTVTAAYSQTESTTAAVTTTTEGYGIGVAYDLGGGAAVKGAIGEVAGNTVADLGITMSF